MCVPREKLSIEGFLAWEEGQSERHYFWRGEVYAMVGVRQSHAIVALNLAAAIKLALRGTPCRTFMADMRLRIDAAEAVFYPDVMVSCDARDRTTPTYLSHPKLVVEVLSPAMADFDRGAKFAAYRLIDTLEEYALIDVDARRVELFRRNAAGRWELYEFNAGQAVEFASVGLSLSPESLYENVEPAE